MKRIIERIDGLDLSAVEAGSGAKTMLFIHGAACDGSDWDRQMAAFGAAVRTVAIDLPAHGLSDSAPDLTIERLGAAVAGFAIARDYRGIVLVGHSFGCRVVLQAAILLGERMAGMVLLDGTNFATREIGRTDADVAAAIEQAGFANFLAASFAEMFVPASDPVFRGHVIDRARTWASEAGKAIVLNTIRWDTDTADRAIAAIAVPILLLQSTYVGADFKRRSLQPGMTTPWTEKIQNAIPATRLTIIPEAGHFPHVEQAAIVTAALRAFLEDLAQRKRTPDRQGRPA